MRDLKREILVIRNWIKRNNYKAWNADDLVKHIKHNWPYLKEDEVDHIFQNCWPTSL